MRLHRLTMTAFGPFGGTEVVDFDTLTASGLFLLHGPTGAGKTSVLDAICYALYGQVPGARSGARLRVRSDHAPPDRQPLVQVEVTLGGRRLEVTRTPEWVRPRKRGAGVTTQPASIHVRELVERQWQPLTTRHDEAAQLLLDLLGMGHEQFTKLVLLPQGEFAAFLRADAEQRRALLGRLFAIERFAGVETCLADERRRLAIEVDLADQQTAALLARASEAFAGLPDTSEIESQDDLDELDDPNDLADDGEVKALQRARSMLERAEVIARRAQVELEAQTERAGAAHAVLAEATTTSARRSRWAHARSRLVAIDAAAPSHAEAVRRIALARRAAPLTAVLDAQAAAVEQAEAALAAVRQARSVAPSIAKHANEERLRAAVASQRLSLGSLGAGAARLTELADLDGRVATVLAEQEMAQLAVTEARTRHEQARVTLARAQAAHQQATVAAADLAGATVAESAAARVVDLVGELGQCEQHALQAQRAHTDAVEADQLARENLIAIRERRLAGIAGELAATLRDGQPCLVCGSQQHPEPAPLGAENVSREDEDVATAAADATRLARDEAAQRLSALHAHRAELLACTGGADLGSAHTGLTAARSRVAAAVRARQACEREAAAVAAATDLREQSAAAQQQQLTREAECSASLSELSQQREVLRAELDRLRGDDADVLARITRLEAELIAMEGLLDALVSSRGADHAVAEQQQQLAAACAECGFVNADEASAAALPAKALDELSAVADEHDRQRGDLVALLADPDLAGVGELPEPDLVAARAQVTQADHDLQRSASRATLSQDAARRLARLARQISQSEVANAPTRQRYHQVDELSACVSGTGGANSLRMRLSAYVLAARLEAVAAAATERLAVMSDGRYALVHSDERVKGGGRSGLGLRVVDAWTGVERDTSTLSGGESFLASLALALGLADVVQAEAGGAAIETLFVDEGFGSLDEDTLEEVMTVLDGLRDGGRVVGLVSHVVDLRARIPSQLHVRKTRSGSTLVPHAPDLATG